MSGCTLGEDLNPEVRLLHLPLVVLLILGRLILALASEIRIGLLEKLLLVLQSPLNDLCAGEQSLLEVSKRLILDHDRSFLVEVLLAETELLKDGPEIVLLLGARRLLLICLFALLHLVARLVINSLLKDLGEQSLNVLVLA